MLEGGPVTSCHVTYGRCHASDVLKIALFFLNYLIVKFNVLKHDFHVEQIQKGGYVFKAYGFLDWSQ